MPRDRGGERQHQEDRQQFTLSKSEPRQKSIQQEIEGDKHHQRDNHVVDEGHRGREGAPKLEVVCHDKVGIHRNQ